MTQSDVTSLYQQATKYEHERQYDQAARLYKQIIAVDPEYVTAHINLGTIHYLQHKFEEACNCYSAAMKADPKYALAYFDLAVVLDELGNSNAAIAHYQTAVTLVPTYADAHYNLALALENAGQSRKALRHWRRYAQLDAKGRWREHALGRIRAILENDPLKVVHTKLSPKITKRRAKLVLVGAEL